MEIIQGFSKLNANEKLDILVQADVISKSDYTTLLSFRHPDSQIQQLFEKFTENVLSAWHLPFSIAPNFLINNRLYHIPMVVEESSVVAAASWSARFWADKGGFRTQVLSMEKTGQIHFSWAGNIDLLKESATVIEENLIKSVSRITENMVKRGGGIKAMTWLDFSSDLEGVFQCRISFLTADSMGANFINSCLEAMGKELQNQLESLFPAIPPPEIIMAILSNYTPDCLVECKIECEVSDFEKIKGISDGLKFARKFKQAVDIAMLDPYRAVTHNKGIFNGMDAVVLATANDFRAFEAGGHAFAARSGTYKSLTNCEISDDHFSYTLQIPIAVGTVGGLTATHPLAKLSLAILANPSAEELMMIIAAAGLANNFSAIKALTSEGIQSGHMKMHLSKILIQLNANEMETIAASRHFEGKTLTHRDVEDFIWEFRDKK